MASRQARLTWSALIVAAALSLGAPAVAWAEPQPGDAADTLVMLDSMMVDAERMVATMRIHADAALRAAHETGDVATAERQMRLFAELSARIADMEALNQQLSEKVEALRAKLGQEAR